MAATRNVPFMARFESRQDPDAPEPDEHAPFAVKRVFAQYPELAVVSQEDTALCESGGACASKESESECCGARESIRAPVTKIAMAVNVN